MQIFFNVFRSMLNFKNTLLNVFLKPGILSFQVLICHQWYMVHTLNYKLHHHQYCWVVRPLKKEKKKKKEEDKKPT